MLSGRTEYYAFRQDRIRLTNRTEYYAFRQYRNKKKLKNLPTELKESQK